MKKLILTAVALIMAGSFTMASAGTAEMGASIGIGYPDYPEQVSLDLGLFADYKINPFLSVGLETGFDWVLKEYNAGAAPVGSLGTLTQKEKYNFYSFPLLGVVTFNIPLGESPVQPFVSGGAGYSWTIYDAPNDNWTFHGFTWQVMAGATFDLGESAMGMKALIEAGYRGTMIETNVGGINVELDMSSPIVRAGVVFPLSRGSDW